MDSILLRPFEKKVTDSIRTRGEKTLIMEPEALSFFYLQTASALIHTRRVGFLRNSLLERGIVYFRAKKADLPSFLFQHR